MSLCLDQPRPQVVNQANTVDMQLATAYCTANACAVQCYHAVCLTVTACSVCTGCVPSVSRRKMAHVARDDCGVLLLGVAYKLNHHPSLPCLHPFSPVYLFSCYFLCVDHGITHPYLVSILFSQVHPYIPWNFFPKNFWAGLNNNLT